MKISVYKSSFSRALLALIDRNYFLFFVLHSLNIERMLSSAGIQYKTYRSHDHLRMKWKYMIVQTLQKAFPIKWAFSNIRHFPLIYPKRHSDMVNTAVPIAR